MRQYFGLTLFFFFLVFLAGRIGLFVHEFAGHALCWHLIGGCISGFTLFVFGGGWVSLCWPDGIPKPSMLAHLAVNSSGILAELTAGIILFIIATKLRREKWITGLLAAASGVLIVHSLFYLVTSVYYGTVDGCIFFLVLQGKGRAAFLLIMSLLTVAGSFAASYAFSPFVRGCVADFPGRNKMLMITLAVFSAAILHGILTIGELVITKDRVYAEGKTSVSVKIQKKELSEFAQNYRKEHGREPDEKAIEKEKKTLKKKYGQFPIEPPLGLGVFLAFCMGFNLSKNKDIFEQKFLPGRDIGILALISAFTIMFILIINRISL